MNNPVDIHKIPAFKEIVIRENLKLNPLDNSHAKEILEILERDPIIRTRVTVASRFKKVSDIQKEITTSLADSGLIRYVLILNDKVVGMVSLWRDDGFFGTPPNHDDYGFGYFLDPNHRGKGIVFSTLKKVMTTVSENLHVKQFVAFCEDENKESIAVLKRLGFKPSDETFIEPSNGWIERKYYATSSS